MKVNHKKMKRVFALIHLCIIYALFMLLAICGVRKSGARRDGICVGANSDVSASADSEVSIHTYSGIRLYVFLCIYMCLCFQRNSDKYNYGFKGIQVIFNFYS